MSLDHFSRNSESDSSEKSKQYASNLAEFWSPLFLHKSELNTLKQAQNAAITGDVEGFISTVEEAGLHKQNSEKIKIALIRDLDPTPGDCSTYDFVDARLKQPELRLAKEDRSTLRSIQESVYSMDLDALAKLRAKDPLVFSRLQSEIAREFNPMTYVRQVESTLDQENQIALDSITPQEKRQANLLEHAIMNADLEQAKAIVKQYKHDSQTLAHIIQQYDKDMSKVANGHATAEYDRNGKLDSIAFSIDGEYTSHPQLRLSATGHESASCSNANDIINLDSISPQVGLTKLSNELRRWGTWKLTCPEEAAIVDKK